MQEQGDFMPSLLNKIEKIQSALKIISKDLETAQKHAKKGDFESAKIWQEIAYSGLQNIVQAEEIAQMKSKYCKGANDE